MKAKFLTVFFIVLSFFAVTSCKKENEIENFVASDLIVNEKGIYAFGIDSMKNVKIIQLNEDGKLIKSFYFVEILKNEDLEFVQINENEAKKYASESLPSALPIYAKNINDQNQSLMIYMPCALYTFSLENLTFEIYEAVGGYLVNYFSSEEKNQIVYHYLTIDRICDFELSGDIGFLFKSYPEFEPQRISFLRKPPFFFPNSCLAIGENLVCLLESKKEKFYSHYILLWLNSEMNIIKTKFFYDPNCEKIPISLAKGHYNSFAVLEKKISLHTNDVEFTLSLFQDTSLLKNYTLPKKFIYTDVCWYDNYFYILGHDNKNIAHILKMSSDSNIVWIKKLNINYMYGQIKFLYKDKNFLYIFNESQSESESYSTRWITQIDKEGTVKWMTQFPKNVISFTDVINYDEEIALLTLEKNLQTKKQMLYFYLLNPHSKIIENKNLLDIPYAIHSFIPTCGKIINYNNHLLIFSGGFIQNDEKNFMATLGMIKDDYSISFFNHDYFKECDGNFYPFKILHDNRFAYIIGMMYHNFLETYLPFLAKINLKDGKLIKGIILSKHFLPEVIDAVQIGNDSLIALCKQKTIDHDNYYLAILNLHENKVSHIDLPLEKDLTPMKMLYFRNKLIIAGYLSNADRLFVCNFSLDGKILKLVTTNYLLIKNCKLFLETDGVYIYAGITSFPFYGSLPLYPLVLKFDQNLENLSYFSLRKFYQNTILTSLKPIKVNQVLVTSSPVEEYYARNIFKDENMWDALNYSDNNFKKTFVSNLSFD